MTTPSFRDWAVMLENCGSWRPYRSVTVPNHTLSTSYHNVRTRLDDDDGWDRAHEVRSYILTRIDRKEKALMDELENLAYVRDAETNPIRRVAVTRDRVDHANITVNRIIARLSDDGLPYPEVKP